MSFDNKYIKFSFTSEWDNNMVIAFLSTLPFDSFEDNANGVIAYIPSDKFDDGLKNKIGDVCNKYQINYTTEDIQNRNWNAEWESSFEPVSVDDFCIIKADFHNDIDDSAFKYIINITPEMTFGTGHHETTYLMIKLLKELNIENKKVFDFGTGTGILAILAEKMGAREILAVDNDPVAVDNAKKNVKNNNCTKIIVEKNDHVESENFIYDLVMANINRNVLLDQVQNLSLSLKKGGFLMISGILKEDKNLIVSEFENNSLKLMKTVEKDKWLALKFVAY
ncbi:MAG TPA: 50S ribosomal protein L11 methyltransferase [Bacteroidetes bacterium]|nr:50S ribosomal protein L11 methyltransferase [Bacteroidota bacterium]